MTKNHNKIYEVLNPTFDLYDGLDSSDYSNITKLRRIDPKKVHSKIASPPQKHKNVEQVYQKSNKISVYGFPTNFNNADE